MIPHRVQRKRERGWTMPPNTVYVGRPTKWGNPYRVSENMLRIEAVQAFRRWIESCNSLSTIDAARIKSELRGKNLACWCDLNEPCHADVLLDIANERKI